MSIAIMGGLSLATFLTLINLPALYALLFHVRPPKLSDVLADASKLGGTISQVPHLRIGL